MRLPLLAGFWFLLGAGPALACERWTADLERFAVEDAAGVPERPIVFVGSSSIRLWDDLAADMAPWPVINRGFGGATLAEVLTCADRLIFDYEPQAVVIYAGENDLAHGAAVDGVLEGLQRLAAEAGETPPILFLAIKTAPVRQRLAARFAAANGAVSDLANEQAWLAYVDTVSPLRRSDGGVRGELYRADGLHLNSEGYALWTGVVRAALSAIMGPAGTP